MKCIALTHLAFEDLGVFEEVLTQYQFEVEYRQAGIDSISGAPESPSLLHAKCVSAQTHIPHGAHRIRQERCQERNHFFFVAVTRQLAMH